MHSRFQTADLLLNADVVLSDNPIIESTHVFMSLQARIQIYGNQD